MQKAEHTPTPEPPYYTLDTVLFSGDFAYFDRGKEPVEVRGKAHQSTERYSLEAYELDIRPLPTLKGERAYLHLKPYVLVPDIHFTVCFYPQPKQYADQDPAIGKVIDSYEAPQKQEIEIGQVQASYYQQDRIIEIWECFLEAPFRKKPLLADNNMKQLWTGTERFLLTQFSDAKQIVTPWHDPAFDGAVYETFLRSRGYMPVAPAAYGKLL